MIIGVSHIHVCKINNKKIYDITHILHIYCYTTYDMVIIHHTTRTQVLSLKRGTKITR